MQPRYQKENPVPHRNYDSLEHFGLALRIWTLFRTFWPVLDEPGLALPQNCIGLPTAPRRLAHRYGLGYLYLLSAKRWKSQLTARASSQRRVQRGGPRFSRASFPLGTRIIGGLARTGRSEAMRTPLLPFDLNAWTSLSNVRLVCYGKAQAGKCGQKGRNMRAKRFERPQGPHNALPAGNFDGSQGLRFRPPNSLKIWQRMEALGSS